MNNFSETEKNTVNMFSHMQEGIPRCYSKGRDTGFEVFGINPPSLNSEVPYKSTKSGSVGVEANSLF